MRIAGRTAALLFAAAFAVMSAAPAAVIAGLRCEARTACPMMAKSSTPCHGAPGAAAQGMTAAMGCCETRATATPSAMATGVAPAPVVAVDARVPLPGPVEATVSESWRAERHALGLFTLHAVWRI